MQKLLIADRSDDRCAVLKNLFCRDFEVSACRNGSTALVLLRNMRPDVLILDFSLPEMDGLTLLRELTPDVPPYILALLDYYPDPFVYHAGIDLGVRHYMINTCRAQAIYSNVMELVRYGKREDLLSPPAIAAAHLQHLGISKKHDGFIQLRMGIPLFAQDPAQRLEKELYAAISTLLGNNTPKQIERSIRACLNAAWEQRDESIWQTYFPGCTKCPSNKEFITCIATFTEPPTP